MKNSKTKKHLKLMAVSLSLALAMTGLSIADMTGVNAAAHYVDENTNKITWEKNYSNSKEFYNAEMELNEEMCEEGFVLMKNDDNFLPLSKQNGNKVKVSLFGKNTKTHAYFGYGSSDTSLVGVDGDGNYNREKSTKIDDAFRASDTFEINERLVNFYEDDAQSGQMRLNGNIWSSIDGMRFGIGSGETPVSRYTDEVKNTFKDYNDVAVVLITRVGAEGSDLPKTSLKSWAGYDDSNKLDSARHWDDHYLQLDKDEVDMLQMVMDNFDDVVILFNTNAQFETGFLNDPNHYLFTDNDYATTPEEREAAMNKIKSAIYIGFTGTNGMSAVPSIMDGTVNPSGHLTDTWMRDFKLDPTWQNQGWGGNPDNIRWGDYFVHYEEDIYLGYRYYETRYITEGNDPYTAEGENAIHGTSTTEWNNWYDAHTMYPFGYGLSYTQFEWSDVTVTTSLGEDNVLRQYADDDDEANYGKPDRTQDTITVSVTVTNTGNVAGKDVAQVYYNPPYTAGGISKAHVNLVQFAKTKLLQPDESQTLTMTFNPYDMASYDFSDANGNGSKCYELEEGAYNIVVAHDAHDAADLPAARTGQVTVPDGGFIYDKDPVTGGDVHNRFDDVGGTQKSGNRANNTDTEGFKGVDTYMSRDDFEGTFPTPSETKKNGPKQGKQKYVISEEYDQGKPWYSDEEYPDQAKTPGTSEQNKIKLWHMAGRQLDDPMWEKLLDQLTPEEMAELIGNCVYYTVAIPSIDKPYTKENDGPLGNRWCTSIQWQSAPITAQTFNKELAYKQGLLIGEGGYYPYNNTVGGIYGPGLETHRSAFGGRNMEYYSEDPVLGGYMCAEFLRGTSEMGNYQLVKHFMLNNCEAERNSISTWASEQAIREIYGKAYEIVVKSGNCWGFMSAVSYIGDMPCTTSYELLTGLLREEWGFEGLVISDMLTQDVELAIRAGNDLMLTGNGDNDPRTSDEWLTTTQLHNIRRAAKNILYVMANSFVMNGYGGDALDNIDYGGTNVIYAVEGTDNTLSVATADYEVASPYDISYELSEGTTLPDGMSMTEDGSISGAPRAAGTYRFTVTAKEDAEEGVMFPYVSEPKDYKLVVYSPDNLPNDIIYSENSLGTLSYGAYFSKDIASGAYFDATGKLQYDVEYSLAPGNVLPRGLTLENGVISGTVLEDNGEFFFTLIARAEGKNERRINYFATITKNVISYAPRELPEYSVGDQVSIDLATAVSSSGQNVKYKLSEGSALPEGLELTPTGKISGIPSRAYDDYRFLVEATSENAEKVTAEYVLTIKGLVFDDMQVRDMLVGKAYSFNLHAYLNDGNSGEGKIKFALADLPNNSLPTGFKLLSDGTLVGVANDLGDIKFTVTASMDGYTPTNAQITLSMYDIYGEEVDGMPSNPIQYADNGNVDDGSNAIGIYIAVACCAVAVVAAAVAATCVILKKKNKKG